MKARDQRGTREKNFAKSAVQTSKCEENFVGVFN